MKNLICCLLVCATLTSCEYATSGQMYGTAVGANIGSHVGSIIGGSSRGPVGDVVGSLVGAAIGGAIGYSVTAPKAEVQESDGYSYVAPTEHVSNESYMTQEGCIEVRNLRFIDENHNKAIDPGETCKIIFDLRNVCAEPVENVSPVLTSNYNKIISVSEMQNVGPIEAGHNKTYTAYVKSSSSSIKSKSVKFTLKMLENGTLYDVRTFEVPVTH